MFSDKEFQNLARRRQEHHRNEEIERLLRSEDRMPREYCLDCRQIDDHADGCFSNRTVTIE